MYEIVYYVEITSTVDAFPKVKLVSFIFIYATYEVYYRNLMFFIDIEFVVILCGRSVVSIHQFEFTCVLCFSV